MGASLVLSAQGMKVPSIPPTISPEKISRHVTTEAAHRPPKYANLEIGRVNNRG